MRYGFSWSIWLRINPHRGLPGHGSNLGALGVGVAEELGEADGAGVDVALPADALAVAAEDGRRPRSRTVSPQLDTTSASAMSVAIRRTFTAYPAAAGVNDDPAETVPRSAQRPGRSLEGLAAFAAPTC
jgi:hypothetical protein